MAVGHVAVAEHNRVTRLYAESPLRLLHADKQRDAAWIFSTNLGGGLVGGDHITLDVDAGARSTTLLTTQSSTKVYRGKPTAQRLHVRVAPDALALVLSDPVSCFRDAEYTQTVRFDVDGALIALDWLTCGRDHWTFKRYDASATLVRGGQTIIADRTLLEGPELAERMHGYEAIGFMWFVGVAKPDVKHLRGAQVALSPLADDVHVLRFAARDTETALRALTPLLPINPWTRKF